MWLIDIPLYLKHILCEVVSSFFIKALYQQLGNHPLLTSIKSYISHITRCLPHSVVTISQFALNICFEFGFAMNFNSCNTLLQNRHIIDLVYFLLSCICASSVEPPMYLCSFNNNDYDNYDVVRFLNNSSQTFSKYLTIMTLSLQHKVPIPQDSIMF